MAGKGKSNSEKSCIYCESGEDMTVDHIPPKALFPEPRPSNMLTVPCCKKCNESFSKDDEYFRTVLVSCAPVFFNQNVQAINSKLLRSLRRPEAAGLASTIRNNLHLADISTPGGIYLGTSPAMLVSADRINRVTDRIARGLFYITHDYPVPIGYEVTCVFKDATFSMPEEFIAQWRGFWKKPVNIGKNVFNYSYALCVDNPNGVIFVYWFYGKLWFYGYVLPNQEIEVSQ